MLDLLIKNGLIVDGTGNPGFYGSVVMEGETVHIFRRDSASTEAAQIIDAEAEVICPGFIDMHAHTGLVILAEPSTSQRYFRGLPPSRWAWIAVWLPRLLRLSWFHSP